jgi:uncharacterized RDD family membrane protein YckC
MENQGGGTSAPPPQDWQSQPQQPSAPPPGGGVAAAQPGPVAGTTIADFVTRVVAYVIDAVIIGIVGYVVWVIVFAILPFGIDILVQAIAAVAISAGYFIYFWTNRKQTPGMMVMKLMIVEDGTGNALSQDKAIRRWLYLGLPYALTTLLSVGGLGFGGLGLAGLGALAMLFSLASIAGLIAFVWQLYLAYTTYQDGRRQGVHDKAVNSVVIAVGPSPISGQRS